MFIKTPQLQGDLRITSYVVTPTGDVELTLVSPDPHDPEFIRLNLPEVGAIMLKLLFYFTRR